MPKRVNIPAQDDPEIRVSRVDNAADLETLEAALKEAVAKREEIRAERNRIRDEEPRSKVRGLLAESDEEFTAAIEAANAAEAAYRRAKFGGAAGQRVQVGVARESGKAGK